MTATFKVAVILLTYRMPHSLAANKMQMHVKYGLSAMRTGIDDDAITALMNTFLRRDLTPDQKHVTDQRLILDLQFIDGFDVFVRDDQDMGRRDRMNIAERRHLFIPIHDGCLDFIINDFAEDTISHDNNRR